MEENKWHTTERQRSNHCRGQRSSTAQVSYVGTASVHLSVTQHIHSMDLNVRVFTIWMLNTVVYTHVDSNTRQKQQNHKKVISICLHLRFELLTYGTTYKCFWHLTYPSSHRLMSMCCWIISPLYDQKKILFWVKRKCGILCHIMLLMVRQWMF